VINSQTNSTSSLSVGETAATISGLKAKIHLEVGAAKFYNGSAEADVNSTYKPVLSTWATKEAEVYTANMATGTYMVTGGIAEGQTNSQAVLHEVAGTASEFGWVYFELSAWLEDVSDSTGEANHQAIWKAAVNGATNVEADFEFKYDTGTLNKNEVYYYLITDANATAPTAYTKASEALSIYDATNPESIVHEGSTHILEDISAKDLVTNYSSFEYADETQPMKHLGYLVMRLDGTQRIHTHGSDYNVVLASLQKGDIHA
jgi:hypothetical protein